MHLLYKAASLQQNQLKQCFVYALNEQCNLEKKVKANRLVDCFEYCRLHQGSRQGCLRAPLCIPSSLLWILLEPAMSPGFLPMETRRQGEVWGWGTTLHLHVSPRLEVQTHYCIPKGGHSYMMLVSLSKSTAKNTAYHRAADVHAIFFLLLLHN